MSQKFIVDIHSHSTLRAYNSIPLNGSPNLWDKTENGPADTAFARWARMTTKDIPKYSQANYYAMAEGNVRVVFDSLYPVENGFMKLRKVPMKLMGQKGLQAIMSSVIGLDPKRVKEMFGSNDYFTDLQNQYSFLANGQGKSPDGRYAYKLVSDFSSLTKVTQEEPDTLAVVVTIEGAHCFGTGSPLTKGKSLSDLKEMVSENIKTVKEWEHPPFFITLLHHYWNQLGGHVRSMKTPVNTLFNQSIGLHGGMTELGWHTIQELLTRRNGRRILIDTKHMSMKTRKEFFRFVQQHNYINADDQIPLICSHTGSNGFGSMKSSIEKKDKMKKLKKTYFNSWSMNVSGEEARIVHDSGGLIGVMLDKGLLGGPSTVETIREIESPDEKKEAFLKLIWSNIFQLVKGVGKPSGWDVISLGSDFDGLINAIDCYNTADKLKDAYRDMIEYLQETKFKKDLWYGFSPVELVDKIMRSNALNFLKLHF